MPAVFYFLTIRMLFLINTTNFSFDIYLVCGEGCVYVESCTLISVYHVTCVEVRASCGSCVTLLPQELWEWKSGRQSWWQ